MPSIENEYEEFPFEINNSRSAEMGIFTSKRIRDGKDSFAVKNIFYIRNVAEGEVRGAHAHKKANQILVCLSGRCKITLENGEEEHTVVLDSLKNGLYLGKGLWFTMSEFSPDAVLFVLSSEEYDENEYIRDHEEFLRYRRALSAHEDTFC